MILSTHALDVIISSADEDYKQNFEINTQIMNGIRTYWSTLDRLTYRPEPDTCKVIVYIIDRSRFVEIVRNAVRENRLQIAQDLKEWHYELVFLGIDNFDDDDYHLISAFILDKIRSHNEDESNFTIETIGEDHFDRVYGCYAMDFEMYQENPHICGGTLKARLRSIPRGALRPVGSNGKEIKIRGFHPTVAEVTWPVNVVNNTYFPRVNVSDSKYNFRAWFKRRIICLLILGGKEYSEVTIVKRSPQKAEIWRTLNEMTRINEGLYIMGAFNFDWTEIYIITQIILQHSVEWKRPDYNVFTCGYGMFNSYYLNEYVADGRCIMPQTKSIVSEVIEALMRAEVKERAINTFYLDDDGWKYSEIPINLGNGRYIPTEGFENYTLPWANHKIAFIVCDSTETSVPIDFPVVYQSMEALKQSGIRVVVIEAINFGFYDVHIIAEWIDYHRGACIQNSDKAVIDSEQIAVLGGGIFDTIFQSKSTTYKTLFDTKKNDLKNLRNAFVNAGNGKRVFAAQIDKCSIRFSDPKFDFWTYPMNTVNGFYEPDLIPDQHMFETTGGKNILFIITSANYFHQISTISAKNIKPITQLREDIENYFPYSGWSVFLVGLDNFGERDYHLFAELVKMQTNYERSLEEFILIVSCGIGPPIYRYKDAPPFAIEHRPRIKMRIASFFEMTCQLIFTDCR